MVQKDMIIDNSPGFKKNQSTAPVRVLKQQLKGI